LRGKAETARGERRFDLGRSKSRDQRAALQPFFQSPGGAIFVACFDDEKGGRVKAESEEAWSIRAPPFARGFLGETPQHKLALCHRLGRLPGDHRKGETKRRGVIAIGLSPDLVQPPALEDGGKRKRTGGAGRSRARCGGKSQRHGNLLERADLGAQMLNQDPTPCPACLFNASRRNEKTDYTAWNVVTHAYSPQLSFLFCSRESREESQVRGIRPMFTNEAL